MEAMNNTKFVVTELGNVHGFDVISSFDSAELANAALAERQAKYPHDADQMKVSQVTIKSAVATYDDEIGGIVLVESEIDGESESATFTVQLSESGVYEGQNGCWITTDGGDLDFSEVEKVIFAAVNVVKLAESAARAYDEENYHYHNTRFNCAINSWNLYARENKKTGQVTLVSISSSDTSRVEYGPGLKKHEIFPSLVEAMAHLDQFRTGEHHDFRGLNSYLNSNDSD